MKAYRIAKKNYIEDLSGEGARIFGGRWNNKGTNLLYTSSNRSLATVEFLVHLPITIVPKDIYIAEIFIPDDIKYKNLEIKNLPNDWFNYPAPRVLREITESWIKENESLFMKVPSSVVKGEWNILINPRHNLAKEIKIYKTEAYTIDNRLLK